MSTRSRRRAAEKAAAKGQERLHRGQLPKAMPADLDPRFLAGTFLLGRMGAGDFSLRWLDETAEGPHVWVAQVRFPAGSTAVSADDNADMPGRTWLTNTRDHYEVAACTGDPTRAVLDLCERLVDAGSCTHCARPTIFVPDLDAFDATLGGRLPVDFCLYQWDPELATFRRSCEGDE